MNLRTQLSALRNSAEVMRKRSRDPSRSDAASRIQVNDFKEELSRERGRAAQGSSRHKLLSDDESGERWMQERRSGRRDRVKANLQSRSTSRVKCLKTELLSTVALPPKQRGNKPSAFLEVTNLQERLDERKPSHQSAMPSEDLKENEVLSATREPFSTSQLHIVENLSLSRSRLDGEPEIQIIDNENNIGQMNDLNLRCAKLFQST